MKRNYDVIVVGSGAAGAMVAYDLALSGLSVAVVESGARRNPEVFANDEFEAIPTLYKNGGLQTTRDRRMLLLQGDTVGGSTVINNAIWLRADLQRVLPEWHAVGAELDGGAIELAYNHIERLLRVKPIAPTEMNRGTYCFTRGCERLGIPYQVLSHNREGCLGCGWCNYGCRFNRKTSMLVTFIPWAEELGACVFDRARDARILIRGDRALGVTFQRDARYEELYSAKLVVACGAIGSSGLLLRSGITQRGTVGSCFHALGGVLVSAEVPEKVDSYDGIGLTCLRQPTSRDYVTETFFSPPGAFALAIGGWNAEHARRMRLYCHYVQCGTMVATDPVGRISLKAGRVRIDLRLQPRDLQRLHRGVFEASRILLAGGATAVYPATFKECTIRNEADCQTLTRYFRRPDDLVLGSAHPQGGNPMSSSAKLGVVNSEFRVHGFRNLYVVDASVFPTNIWANCQATVMAIAHIAASHVLR